METKIIENGQIIGALYEKADGSLTTWSHADVMAVNITVLLVGATVLGVLATFA
jgi:hypothetical protein